MGLYRGLECGRVYFDAASTRDAPSVSIFSKLAALIKKLAPSRNR
jgi:hypothetical protein